MPNTSNPCIISGSGCASPTNLPEFIDTAACLCGLVQSRESSSNGNLVELWRCIGNASENVVDGGNGKWFNTKLPSEELPGLAEPQNWAGNPPDLSKTLVLDDVNGKQTYVPLGPKGSPSLIGDDKLCTGKNDTDLSATFYGHKGSKNSSSTATTSLSSSASHASTATASSSLPPSSAATASKGAATTTGAASTPAASSTSKSNDAARTGLKGVLLAGLLLAPIVTLAI